MRHHSAAGLPERAAPAPATRTTCGMSVRFSPPGAGAPQVCPGAARSRDRRDGRKALGCGGGVAAALYVETHEEALRFGPVHPALPLFDLAAECYPDEHRNL